MLVVLIKVKMEEANGKITEKDIGFLDDMLEMLKNLTRCEVSTKMEVNPKNI